MGVFDTFPKYYLTFKGPTLVHQSSPPLEVGTGALAGGLVFLTTNNTMVMAHQGASVTLSCRITKPPNSGMVRMKNISASFPIYLHTR